MATAAVTLPALAAVGWAASRPERATGPSVAGGQPEDSLFATTIPASGTVRFRCMIPAGTDGDWTYYEYCESVAAGLDGSAVAGTFVPVTTLVPPTTPVSIAYDVLGLFNIDGFDTWTPDLISTSLPDNISVVVVVGTDWFDRDAQDVATCVPGTEVPASTASPNVGEPVTTLPPQTTLATC